jgi:hypothetical protein
MRKCASLLVSVLILLTSIGLCNNNSDLMYIRRAYLTELGIPPSIAEIEWLMEYNFNTMKESGIEYILDRKYGKDYSAHKEQLKQFYLHHQTSNILSTSQQDLILKYQAGGLNLSLEQAKTTLVKYSLIAAENQEDPIDYLFLCLCGRYTNTQESNYYNKIYKNQSGTEFENMYSVLQIILSSNTFLMY